MALPEGAYDPLFRRDLDPFWQQVDPYRNPVRESDIEFLGSLDLNPLCQWRADLQLTVPPLNGGAVSLRAPHFVDAGDGNPALNPAGPSRTAGPTSASARKARAAPAAVSSPVRVVEVAEEQHTRLDSFPLTTRLVAALLDEGPGVAVATTPHGKKNAVVIPPVPGMGSESSTNVWPTDPFFHGVGEPDATRSHQKVVEERVGMELRNASLLDDPEDDDLVREIRLEQWRLRDLKTANRTKKNAILQKVYTTELKQQAKRREIKQGNDELEYLYLDRMIKKAKKNKRAKSKYQRLANQWFPFLKYRKDGTIGVEMPTDPNAPPSTGTGIGPPSTTGPVTPGTPAAPVAKGKGSKKAKSKRPPPRDPVTPLLSSPTAPPTAVTSANPKTAADAAHEPTPGQFLIPENVGENIKIIVGAINQAGGQAQLEYIIDKYLQAFPGLSGDKAKRRVISCLTNNKTSIQFRKSSNGDYSPMIVS